MSDGDRTKYIELVAKLVAKEQSTRELGNEEEASAFAAKIQELLEKYELSMSDLEFETRRGEEPVEMTCIDWTKYGFYRNTRRRDPRREVLAAAISCHHGCDILIVPISNRIWIVGRKTNRQVAEYVIGTIMIACEKLAQSAYDKRWREAKRNEENMAVVQGFKGAWQDGFVMRILERLQEEQDAKKASAETCTALVRLRTEHDDVRAHIDEMKGVGKAQHLKGRREFNPEAMEAGYHAGGSVNLKANAIGSNQSKVSDKLEA